MVSRGQRGTLCEALAGVARQAVKAELSLTLWWDGCVASPAADAARAAVGDLALAVREFCVPGDQGPAGGSFERIAWLRDLAAAAVSARYVCFLDDDNIWDTDHLAALSDLARTGLPAVHSWRRLITPTGADAVVSRFPWLPEGPESVTRFGELVRLGVFEPGSPVVKDTVGPLRPGLAGMVDLGAWLIEADLLRRLGFRPRPRSAAEVEGRLGEDDLLLEQLVRHGVPTGCTRRASYRYRLGGMSTAEFA